MLKIPELPIYNTERYTNFSPISPDDIKQGQIYTNDELFIYVTYLSNNKTANYVPWNGDGEYVGIDMSSSDNIYAIVTYLNNNNFRPLDYDLEVVDPYNTDRRLLLTPNGIKKVSDVDESVVKAKLAKAINEQVRRTLKENIDGGHRMPKSIQGRMNQIYRAVNKYGLSSKKFYDEYWNALNLYDKVISDLGYELSYWCENGGYCDYDEYTHMPMSKQYEIVITCDDGVEIGGYIKMMAAGTVEDPFDAYDTCMVLWPRR